ncbi:MAG TPA: hypothetical protein VL947_03935 [Cytophagales bacterium]|nr:hypothetical protein [Cytophagales bacterium]
MIISACLGSCKQDRNNATASQRQDTTTHVEVLTPLMPTGYSVLDSAMGDLDEDSIPELVYVLETSIHVPCQMSGDSTCLERAIWIFKSEGADWKLWFSKTGSLIWPSGTYMYSDGFVDISIDSTRRLVTTHNIYTGSHLEGITYYHKYRFDNSDFSMRWYVNLALRNMAAIPFPIITSIPHTVCMSRRASCTFTSSILGQERCCRIRCCRLT